MTPNRAVPDRSLQRFPTARSRTPAVLRRSRALALAAAVLGLSAATAANGASAPLLLTEISVTPTSAEYIEIHNPNAVPVDLSDVYLSDATFQPFAVYYYNIVTGDRVATGGGDFGDFTARFPDGASIPAGAYQVVALSGSDAFVAAHGSAPDYELFEDGAGPDSIPDMREAIGGSINDQGTLNDGREIVVLFAWDGASDLVVDLDYVIWGDQDAAVDKTGVSRDGPDGDSNTSTYLPDTPVSNQQVIATGAHPDGQSFQRDDLGEGTETTSGGNGIDGDDETSENLAATWCIEAATPGAASNCTTLPPLTCATPTTPIHAVQGSGTTSPLAGSVVAINGIVVADFANGQPDELGGFFVQEPASDQDADPMTSEGIFVRSTALDVVAGDLVAVRGQAEESFGVTRLSNVSDALICGTGRSFTPVSLTLPLDDPSALERIEGMAITLPQALVVTDHSNLARFGEFTLSNGRLFQPTQVQPPGTAAIAQQAANDRNRLLVDDGRTSTYGTPFVIGADGVNPLGAANPVRSGYTVTGLQGAMHFTFGSFKVEPSATIDFDETAAPRSTAPEIADAPVRVAGLNVLNFFSTLDDAGPVCGPASLAGCRGADTAGELARQTDKLVSAILALDADVVALSELENNADASLQALVGALNALTSPGTWSFVDAGAIGTDAIKVGLIYTPATMASVGFPAILDSGVDPRFDSTLNRPSLAQTFEHLASGERITISANHLKSRGCSGAVGADTDQGDGQACFNATRTLAAQALLDWLSTDPTGSGETDFLVIGDLNSYALEDPIQALVGAGLVNLGLEYDEADNVRTFEFFGEHGALDHALASPSLALQVLDASHWHINADEIPDFDYNEENLGAGAKPASFFDPGPYRASDHDPIIVSIVPGPGIVDARSDQTFLDADRQFANADGIDAVEVSVQLVNRDGQPVAGVPVELIATGSASFAEDSGITDPAGRFTTLLSNAVIEIVSVRANYDADGSGTASAPIINGAPRQIAFRDPSEFVFADGFE